MIMIVLVVEMIVVIVLLVTTDNNSCEFAFCFVCLFGFFFGVFFIDFGKRFSLINILSSNILKK